MEKAAYFGWLRSFRYEPATGCCRGTKAMAERGKRNLPFCSDRQGQKGGMDKGEGVNACTDGRGTGRRRRVCLYAHGNRT